MNGFNKPIDCFYRFSLYYLGKAASRLVKTLRGSRLGYGALKEKSAILSDVAHALIEAALPKKTIEWLSRLLDREPEKNFRDGFKTFRAMTTSYEALWQELRALGQSKTPRRHKTP